jgi:hypothetical protein
VTAAEGASPGVADPPDNDGPIFAETDPSGRYGRVSPPVQTACQITDGRA